MQYLELSLAVLPRAVDTAADLLRKHVPAGVSIEPPFEAIDEEGGVAFDGEAAVPLRAWLAVEGVDSRPALAALRRDLRSLGDDLIRPLRSRAVADADWAEAWKRHFPVLRVGRHLVVRPSWRRHLRRRDDIVIELDPGMAFGTGQHATTRLCLEALEERLTPGATVLDVGTGSGILAVAAALLGATRVDALDIDPAAHEAATENAARNGVETTVRVGRGSLGESWPFPEVALAGYDFVLANLSSRLVQELAPLLVAAIGSGGCGLISGLIEEHEAACCAALTATGGAVTEVRADEAWRLLVVEAGVTSAS